MDLSKRLRTMASMVENRDLVLDVGTDHGYLAMTLVNEERAGRVLATDISAQSLSKLEAKLTPKDKNIDTMVADGFKEIQVQPDLTIIGGMGGPLILSILKEDMDKTRAFKDFIIQANTKTPDLRRFFIENSFEILEEAALWEEGYFYNILRVSYHEGYKEEYQPWELEYGRLLLQAKDEASYEKINKDQERLEKVLEDLKNQGKASHRRNLIKNELDHIRKARDFYED